MRAIEDRTHALRVARALSGHLRAVGLPMYVYIDVSPRDLEWPALVRALLSDANVRILVTIREEDFARLTASRAEIGGPETVALELTEAEAEELYDAIIARRPRPEYLSFAEAWDRFGAGGPLLEFVHLVTQSESLADRLRSQVRRLRDEANTDKFPRGGIQLLRAVSVAAAYEARVDLRSLTRDTDIPDVARVLELLEREYLVRRSPDGSYAEGLHPSKRSPLR